MFSGSGWSAWERSREEIDALVKSMDINELAVDAEIEAAKVGVKDWEVWAAAHYAMTRNGSELPIHCFWVSGKNPKRTLTRPSMRGTLRQTIGKPFRLTDTPRTKITEQELAQAMGAVVTGSRPIVDQGWLAATRLVGKSGQAVKPKIYLALGISGAPEHVEAVTGSDMIIAINTDPTAPIFNLAKFGSTVDVLDLLPVLTEKIIQARGGS